MRDPVEARARVLYQLQSRRFLIRRPSHVVKPLDRVCMLHRFTNQSRVFSTPQDCQDQTCGAGSRRAPTVVHDHAAHFTRSKCNITPLLRNACSVPAAAAGSYKSMLMVIESKQESGVLLQHGASWDPPNRPTLREAMPGRGPALGEPRPHVFRKSEFYSYHGSQDRSQ